MNEKLKHAVEEALEKHKGNIDKVRELWRAGSTLVPKLTDLFSKQLVSHLKNYAKALERQLGDLKNLRSLPTGAARAADTKGEHFQPFIEAITTLLSTNTKWCSTILEDIPPYPVRSEVVARLHAECSQRAVHFFNLYEAERDLPTWVKTAQQIIDLSTSCRSEERATKMEALVDLRKLDEVVDQVGGGNW